MSATAKSLVALSALAIAGPAYAGVKPAAPTSIYAVRPDMTEITVPATTNHNGPALLLAPYSTGFEAPFVPGTINGQQGWATNAFTGGAIAANADISTVNPQTGVQDLRLTDFTGVSSGTATGAFSPVAVVAGPAAVVASYGMRIDGVTPGPAGGADYFFAGQSPAQAATTFKVDFSYLGNIDVLDYPGVGATGTLAYQHTTATWVPGQYYNVTVTFTPSPTATPGTGGVRTGIITYAVNGVPVYTADSLINGTTVDQLVLTSDNFQLTGESGTLDNLSIVTSAVPEPTTLAAIAGASLTMLRRRRA